MVSIEELQKKVKKQMIHNPWTIIKRKNAAIKTPIFIEGLPGIGNVGKVVVDYLIEKSDAKLVANFSSPTLPNSVFVTEENLVQMPQISVYHKKEGKQDILFMTGDVQPSEEVSSYKFCEKVIEYIEGLKCKNVITMGGIGLQEEPQKPKVFVTGNDKKFVTSFKKSGADPNVYGVVGPIIGVSGLLLGLTHKKIPAAALLAETFGHPMYLGLKGAREILILLNKAFKLDYSLDDIDDEIKELEEQNGQAKNPKLDNINRLKKRSDMNYIG